MSLMCFFYRGGMGLGLRFMKYLVLCKYEMSILRKGKLSIFIFRVCGFWMLIGIGRFLM